MRFLFKGIKLLILSDLYQNNQMLDSYRYFKEDYTNYTCTQSNFVKFEGRKPNIEVKAVSMGYRKSIPIDDLTILKATVKLRRGNLKGIYFKQLNPWFIVDSKTNITDSITKRQLVFEDLKLMDLNNG